MAVDRLTYSTVYRKHDGSWAFLTTDVTIILSPTSTLPRSFTVTYRQSGAILSPASQTPPKKRGRTKEETKETEHSREGAPALPPPPPIHSHLPPPLPLRVVVGESLPSVQLACCGQLSCDPFVVEKARRRSSGVFPPTNFTSMVARHGVPPLSARHLQEAIVGSTMMFGAEITWKGQRSMSKAFQVGINRMTRATLGVLPSTPAAFLQAEGGSVPAIARLQGRQEAFAVRLESKDEPAFGLLHTDTGLGERLRDMIGMKKKGGSDRRKRGTGQVQQGNGLPRGDCHPGSVL